MMMQQQILLADGSGSMRGLIHAIMRASGYAGVTEAVNFKEALSVLRACEIELLIVASEIEGQSTLDVINLIRAGKAGCKKKLPIIVLGSPFHDAEAFEAQAIHAGASAYVAMPLSIKKVFPVVHAALHPQVKKNAHKMIVSRPGFSRFLMKKLSLKGWGLDTAPELG
jgi:DNA-binding response OmpR family regulator